MAASVQYTGLVSAGQRGDYRVQRKPVELVGGTQDWMEAVRASSSRATAQNTTAMQVSGAMGRTGLEGITTLGATSLRSEADLAAAGLNAVTQAYSAKTAADAAIERERVARGSEALQGLKLAGALGLGVLGLTTA